MTIPASWRGLYKIESDNEGIYVWVKPQKGNSDSNQGFLFSILKKGVANEDFMDNVGSKRYVKAKGITYVIGGPTGLGMSESNPDFNIYLKLSREKYSVASSVKTID